MSESIWTWTVDASEYVGERADIGISKALEAELGSWKGEAQKPSRSQIKRLIEEEQITADGSVLKANSKLREGSKIQLRVPAPKKLELVPEDRPLDILYQDEHLIVLNKPPGLTVHPSETQTDGTLVHALLHHVKDLSGIGGVLRPGIVHRLDKNTSGALMVTKTDAAHRTMVEVFSKHAIERSYWALCYGAPVGQSEVRIETQIGRNPSDRKKMTVLQKEGRKAITFIKKREEYALSGKSAFASWLECTLETGRTHQVRVHLTHIGHSILGDPVYGTPTSKQTKWVALPQEIRDAVSRLPGQALHARVLGFDHPVTGKRLRFEAAPPPEFQMLLEALKKHLC